MKESHAKAIEVMTRILEKQRARTDEGAKDRGIALTEKCIADLRNGVECQCCKNLCAALERYPESNGVTHAH